MKRRSEMLEESFEKKRYSSKEKDKKCVEKEDAGIIIGDSHKISHEAIPLNMANIACSVTERILTPIFGSYAIPFIILAGALSFRKGVEINKSISV